MQHLTIVRMVINTSAQPLPRAPLCAVLHKCSFLFCSVLFSIARALFSVMLSFFLSLSLSLSLCKTLSLSLSLASLQHNEACGPYKQDLILNRPIPILHVSIEWRITCEVVRWDGDRASIERAHVYFCTVQMNHRTACDSK